MIGMEDGCLQNLMRWSRQKVFQNMIFVRRTMDASIRTRQYMICSDLRKVNLMKLQCDNLKTGVTTHGRSEVTLNKSYNDLAEHYGTAILPCRVRSPKDKAMVEGTVGVICNFILAALRNRRFLSLADLNEAIGERLYEFNHKPFQKKDGSRALAFEEEKPFLLPLPPRPFELATWKIATKLRIVI